MYTYRVTHIKKSLLNILNHKGHANQNDIEIPPHPSQNGYQENKQQMPAEDVGKKEPYTLLVGM
jgi:hypothetical protein